MKKKSIIRSYRFFSLFLTACGVLVQKGYNFRLGHGGVGTGKMVPLKRYQ